MKIVRKKTHTLWEEMPLNKKFSLVILGVLVLPILLSMYFFLNTLQEEDLFYLEQDIRGDLEQIKTFAYSNSTTATAVISMVQSNPQLTNFLNEHKSTQEMIDFHSDITPYYETIVSSNPYMRGLRIYANTEYMPERYPVFLDVKRVEEELWYQESVSHFMQKRMNYNENLSDHINQYKGEGLVSFYQSLNLHQENKAVVEVSYYLEGFFGEIFAQQGNGICVVQNENDFLVSENHDLSQEQINFFENLILQYGEQSMSGTIKQNNGHNYLISGIHCSNLNLNYFIITDVTDRTNANFSMQVALFFIIVLLFVAFAFIFQHIAHVLLRRIYQTVDAMKQLESGNTSVQIENPTSDEIGQLQSYFNLMVAQINTLIEQESSRALLEKDAELKALQNQINSHFLYNVLNNIEMMAIIEENYLIADTVTALARLLRYSMKWDRQMVPLRQELDYVCDYIQLFNMRFDNEISLICEVDTKTYSGLIPKMSVQPVVENAIVHGIEHLTSDEIIHIVAVIDGNDLSISITDSGSGMDVETLESLQKSLFKNESSGRTVSGIGLHNVNERILTRFGENYGVFLESVQEEYTKVTLKLPFTLEDKEHKK